jgi:hypothetical protein
MPTRALTGQASSPTRRTLQDIGAHRLAKPKIAGRICIEQDQRACCRRGNIADLEARILDSLPIRRSTCGRLDRSAIEVPCNHLAHRAECRFPAQPDRGASSAGFALAELNRLCRRAIPQRTKTQCYQSTTFLSR